MCADAQVCVYLTGINAAAGKQLYLRNLFIWSYKKDRQKVRNNGLMSFL